MFLIKLTVHIGFSHITCIFVEKESFNNDLDLKKGMENWTSWKLFSVLSKLQIKVAFNLDQNICINIGTICYIIYMQIDWFLSFFTYQTTRFSKNQKKKVCHDYKVSILIKNMYCPWDGSGYNRHW